MKYCPRCKAENPSHASFCANCDAPLPRKDREHSRSEYDYDIHMADYRHKLKIEAMDPGEKLALLGGKKWLFLGNLFLILIISALLFCHTFCTDNGLLNGVVRKYTGLFGPNGELFTGLYILALLITLFIAANPLFTRNTYDAPQLIPTMVLEFLLLPILGITVWTDGYFGDFMGTKLSTGGFLLLTACLGALILQILLIRTYRLVRKSGVYSYVAN